MPKEMTLTEDDFDRFLAALDPDRDRAGERYEQLRNTLVRLFASRGAASPEDLADETLNRVASGIGRIGEIEDIRRYVYGVANNILRESQRRRSVQEEVQIPFPNIGEDEAERQLDCLDLCLQKLTPRSRELILNYYQAQQKSAGIEHRKMLAEKLGVGLNELRVQSHRIRASLEKCVKKCLGEDW